MNRQTFSPRQTIAMAARALALAAILAAPILHTKQSAAGGPSVVEEIPTKRGGIGLVLLMSLQRA